MVVLLALNKSDINSKKEIVIDSEELSKELGCPVIKTISTSKKGLNILVNSAIQQATKSQVAPFHQNNIDLTNKSLVEKADKENDLSLLTTL